jgi:hypothetical protein
MSEMNINANDLIHEIDTCFPLKEMPATADLSFHQDNCSECDELREDLETYRGKDISGDVIRLIHQQLYSLSADATLWILPYYLKYCLTPEAIYSSMETEYLIYSLRPSPEFKHDTLQRLSSLNGAQIRCLIHFLEWCASHEYWREYCPEDIGEAILFLNEVVQSKA